MVSPLKKNKKIVGGEKIPTNVQVSPMDIVSFNSENVMKWKSIYHMRISPKRELSNEALKYEEIV